MSDTCICSLCKKEAKKNVFSTDVTCDGQVGELTLCEFCAVDLRVALNSWFMDLRLNGSRPKKCRSQKKQAV